MGTGIDLKKTVVNSSIPRKLIDGQFTNFLLDSYKQKSLRLIEQKSNLNHQNREL